VQGTTGGGILVNVIGQGIHIAILLIAEPAKDSDKQLVGDGRAPSDLGRKQMGLTQQAFGIGFHASIVGGAVILIHP